jgi:hypothetical protein
VINHRLLAGAAAIVAAVIYGPMLRPGFALRYDLVSVPRPVLGEDALGLGDRLPRAIPLDAAVALLAKVLPDALLTQCLGLLALTLAGWGVAVLTPAPLAGRMLALLVAEWNPFVLEQLAIGHLPHLFGYGALPWVAVFGRALVRATSTADRDRRALTVIAPGAPTVLNTGTDSARTDRKTARRPSTCTSGEDSRHDPPSREPEPAVSPPNWDGRAASSAADVGRCPAEMPKPAGRTPPGAQGRGWSALSAWGGLTAAAGFGSLTPGGGVLVLIAGLAGMLAGYVAPLAAAPGPTSHSSPAALGPAPHSSPAALGETPHRDAARTRRGRRVAIGAVSLVVLQLPWLVAAAAAPAFTSPAGETGSEVTAFALRSETGWGRLIDAVGLAGMWNGAALPPSRDTVLARVSTVLLVGLALAGLPAVRRFWRAGRRAEVLAVASAAGLGYLVAVVPVLPGGEQLLGRLMELLPGAGLLRDGHRWLGLPAVAVAVLCGLGVSELAGRVPHRGAGVGTAARTAVALFVALLVIASMPDLAGGLGGRLRSRDYPAQWVQMRELLDHSDDRSRVLVLPWQPFRVFDWSGPDPVLDPAPRLLPRQSIVSDALTVSGQRLPEEGLGSRAIGADLADGELSASRLRSLAVGWVLIERGTPGRLPLLPAGWSTVLVGPDLTLLRAPDPLPAAPRAGTARATTVLAAHTVAGGLFLSGLIGLLLSRFRRAGSGRRRLVPGLRRRAGDPDGPP